MLNFNWKHWLHVKYNNCSLFTILLLLAFTILQDTYSWTWISQELSHYVFCIHKCLIHTYTNSIRILWSWLEDEFLINLSKTKQKQPEGFNRDKALAITRHDFSKSIKMSKSTHELYLWYFPLYLVHLMTMCLSKSRSIADFDIILKCLALSKVVHLGYVYQTECLNCNFLSSDCKLNNGNMHSNYRLFYVHLYHNYVNIWWLPFDVSWNPMG